MHSKKLDQTDGVSEWDILSISTMQGNNFVRYGDTFL
jgi:hypothetical protein